MNIYCIVAPRAGAWIETKCNYNDVHDGTSLPVRERGLKHHIKIIEQRIIESLPVRERGLKLFGLDTAAPGS